MAKRASPQGRVTIRCERCEVEFSTQHNLANRTDSHRRRYCSRVCAIAAVTKAPKLTCLQCGTTVDRPKQAGGGHRNKQIYCSPACQHRSLDKGGTVHHSGYRYIHVDKQPVAEHRHVMQRVLGRALFADETVHHKDGDRLNNDPSNLELWSSRHPKGQRVDDKLAFAQDMINRYGANAVSRSEAIAGLMGCC